MDTTEHTELGDALSFLHWDILQDNPYVQIDAKGTLHINLLALSQDNLPEPVNLTLSAGTIIAMSGDYFGGREVAFELPSLTEFSEQKPGLDTQTYASLGDYLIKKTITSQEEQKLICSYKRLANPQVTEEDIKTIYKINDSNYIPFSKTLNAYFQQLMFAIRVKNYSEILNRNLSHFTPWSIRAYTIGHYIALKYARLAYDFQQLAHKPEYQSQNQEFNHLLHEATTTGSLASEKCIDLAHRYQALALGMEFFCFHYYTDHFAAGHVALMGDLRALLPERFGIWGSILVNNLHDELNRVTVYAKKPYDPTPDPTLPPIAMGGDGNFDTQQNYFNKLACMAGMTCSLEDIHQVLQGHKPPVQKDYGGLEYMPDIDDKYRQPQPLILLGKDNKIYYRTQLSVISTLSPSQLQAAYKSPLKYGYTELSSKWEAFKLVFKLRVLPFIYEGKMQPLSAEKLRLLEEEEAQLNPGRYPIPALPLAQEPIIAPAWRTNVPHTTVIHSLLKNSALQTKPPAKQPVSDTLVEEERASLTM